MRARDNPFRSELIERLPYRFQGATWARLLDRLKELNHRAAIVGQHGSGKTTLLEQLADHLQEQGFSTSSIRLDEEHRKFDGDELQTVLEQMSATHIILLDGAEQMSWPAWRRFLWQTRATAGLIITTHQPGRLPTLIECRTSTDLLSALVAELLGVNAQAVRDQAADLYSKHRGNIREALRELYDRSNQVDQSTVGAAYL
jgi:energy-coupling factor transporter ATP-binding protein EcfA2